MKGSKTEAGRLRFEGGFVLAHFACRPIMSTKMSSTFGVTDVTQQPCVMSKMDFHVPS